MREVAISQFFVKYIVIWVAVCCLAVAIPVRDRKRLMPEWREYWRFLSVPWKLWLFGPVLLRALRPIFARERQLGSDGGIEGVGNFWAGG